MLHDWQHRAALQDGDDDDERGMYTWIDSLHLQPHDGDPQDWGNKGFQIVCQDDAALRASFQYVTAARFNKAAYDLARSPDCPHASKKVGPRRLGFWVVLASINMLAKYCTVQLLSCAPFVPPPIPPPCIVCITATHRGTRRSTLVHRLHTAERAERGGAHSCIVCTILAEQPILCAAAATAPRSALGAA